MNVDEFKRLSPVQQETVLRLGAIESKLDDIVRVLKAIFESDRVDP